MQPDNLQWLINNSPDFETLPFTGVTGRSGSQPGRLLQHVHAGQDPGPAGRAVTMSIAVDGHGQVARHMFTGPEDRAEC